MLKVNYRYCNIYLFFGTLKKPLGGRVNQISAIICNHEDSDFKGLGPIKSEQILV